VPSEPKPKGTTSASRTAAPLRNVGAREAVALAFERIGGWEELVRWVEESDHNREIFFARIWPRLLPLKMSSEAASQVVVEVRFAGLND
jgi:hypothetical protein